MSDGSTESARGRRKHSPNDAEIKALRAENAKSKRIIKQLKAELKRGEKSFRVFGTTMQVVFTDVLARTAEDAQAMVADNTENFVWEYEDASNTNITTITGCWIN